MNQWFDFYSVGRYSSPMEHVGKLWCLENIRIRAIFLTNWIPGFRGFKLMEMNSNLFSKYKEKTHLHFLPIGSMYGIFGYIYHKELSSFVSK